MKQLELVFRPKEFQLGDMVKILSKSVGWSFGDSSTAQQGYGWICKKFKEYDEVGVMSTSMHGDFFCYKDLELIERNKK